MTETLPLIETDFAIEAIYLQDSAAEWSCERRHPNQCDREAVYRTYWGPDEVSGNPCVAGDYTKSGLLCLPCFSYYSQPDGLICCAKCAESGVQSFIRIKWSEPARKM